MLAATATAIPCGFPCNILPPAPICGTLLGKPIGLQPYHNICEVQQINQCSPHPPGIGIAPVSWNIDAGGECSPAHPHADCAAICPLAVQQAGPVCGWNPVLLARPQFFANLCDLVAANCAQFDPTLPHQQREFTAGGGGRLSSPGPGMWGACF